MTARAPTFAVGCAGRIVEHRRLDDGRFHLLLYGERRFRIERELESGALYRTVQAELFHDPEFGALPPSVQHALEATREKLETSMLQLVRLTAPDSVETLGERMRTLDPLLLTSAIAFGLDGPILEKQSLLESADPLARAGSCARARVPDRQRGFPRAQD
jgi:Lon protease-like protein